MRKGGDKLLRAKGMDTLRGLCSSPCSCLAARLAARLPRGKGQRSANLRMETSIAYVVAETRTQDRCVCQEMTVGLFVGCVFLERRIRKGLSVSAVIDAKKAAVILIPWNSLH